MQPSAYDAGESGDDYIANTPTLYRPTRMYFGVAAVPTLFQQVIDIVIHRILGIVPYVDDLLITGETE